MSIIDAAAKLRIYECAEFKAWLADMLVNNPNGVGSELVLAIPGTDNVARADALLAAAETLGMIERTAYTPSTEQLFFGVGGASGAALQSGASKGEVVRGYHGQLYMYRVADREAVEAYVGPKPERAKYSIGDRVNYAPGFCASIGMPELRKSRGVVVGYAFGGAMPRVRWADDPKTEPACQSPTFDGSCSRKGYAAKCDEHENVPYQARPVAPGNLRKADR